MASSTCSGDPYIGVLQNNLTGGANPAKYYACAFPSSYTRAETCCGTSSVNVFEDACYSWCDMPSSLNDKFIAETLGEPGGISAFDYFRGCLNETGEDIGPLWCRLTHPMVIENEPTTTTESAAPTSTFDKAEYCATIDPQRAISIGVPEGWPSCGMFNGGSRTDKPEHDVLLRCCEPAPVDFRDQACYVNCYLPRGNKFRGLGNLTDDQILGSFQTCVREWGSGTDAGFEGLICGRDQEPIDLKNEIYETKERLTGGRIETDGSSRPGVSWKMLGLGLLGLMALRFT